MSGFSSGNSNSVCRKSACGSSSKKKYHARKLPELKTFLLVVGFAAILIPALIYVNAASSMTINLTTSSGSTVCPKQLGGSWVTKSSTCNLSGAGLTLPSGTTLVVGKGVIVNGNFTNQGMIQNYGTFNVAATDHSGDFENENGGVVNIGIASHFMIDVVFTNLSNGTFNNPAGTVVVNSGGTLDNEAGGVVVNSAAINVLGTLLNAGTIVNTNSAMSNGIIMISGKATNAGIINNGPALDILSGGSLTNNKILNSPGTLSNNGTLVNSGTANLTGTTNNYAVITNNGPMTNSLAFYNFGSFTNNNATIVNSGSFYDQGGSLTNHGTWNNTANALLWNEGKTSKITNDGTIINSGQLMNGAGYSNPTIYNYGTISNSGIFTNAYTVSSSGTISNSGKMNLNSGTSFAAFDVENSPKGQISLTGSMHSIGESYFYNSGTFQVGPGGIFLWNGRFTNSGNFTNDGSTDFYGTTTGSVTNKGSFVNEGTLDNHANFLNSGQLLNDGPFHNFANVGNSSEGLTLTNTGTFVSEGTLTNQGTFLIQGGAMLNVTYATFTNGGTLVIASNGQFNNFATTNSTGSIENHGTVTNGGTLYTDLFTNDGTLHLLISSLTVVNTNFYNEIIFGSPGVIVDQGAFLMCGGGNIINSGVISNAGDLETDSTGTITNYGVVNNTGTIESAGTLVDDCNGTIYGGGSATITTLACRTPVIKVPAQGDILTTSHITVNGTANPRATITVFAGKSSLGKITANATGYWSLKTFALSNGTNILRAQASGVDGNSPNSSSVTISIVLKKVAAFIVCSPGSLASGSKTICTITVKDSSSSPITPTGTVKLSSSLSGTFNATSCTLVAVNGTTARCAVSFTPSSTGSYTLTASYSGDNYHIAASAKTVLTVS